VDDALVEFDVYYDDYALYGYLALTVCDLLAVEPERAALWPGDDVALSVRSVATKIRRITPLK